MIESANDELRKLVREEVAEAINSVFYNGPKLGKDLLTEEEVAEMLGFKRQTLALWRSSSKGPNFMKLGGAIRYARKEVMEWMNSQKVKTH